MKKIYVFLFAFCFSFALVPAQSLMTNAEIFNFDVGDIFQFQRSASWQPPTYSTKTITSKSYSVTLDTLYYTSYVTRFTPQSCPTCPAIYDTLFQQMVIANLDDTVGAGLGVRPFYWSWDCIDTTGYTGTWMDSTYFDSNFCNRQITKINLIANGPQLIDSCYSYFEPEFGEYQYGNGIGQRFYSYNSCGQGGAPGCDEQILMTFYRKGNDSCGLRFHAPIPTAVDSPREAALFKIVPNPMGAQSQLIFAEPQDRAVITITNLLGTTIKTIAFSGLEMTLDANELAKGTYYLQVDDGLRRYSTKLFVQ